MAPSPKSQLLGVSIAMLILTPLFVSLRVRTRFMKGNSLFLEDWLLVAALLISMGECIALIIGTTAGIAGSHETFGSNHEPIIDAKHIFTFKIYFTVQVLNVACEGLTKVSLLLLYRRIFTIRTFRLVNNVCLAISAAWTICFTIMTIFQCTPVDTFWVSPTSSTVPGKCVYYLALYDTITATDIATDVMILALPIVPVWKLYLPLRQRIGILSIFLLGIFIIAINSIRLHEFVVVDKLITINPLSAADLSYNEALPFRWSLLSATIGVICACLPTFSPLFDPSVKGSFTHFVSKRIPLFRPRDPVASEQSEAAVPFERRVSAKLDLSNGSTTDSSLWEDKPWMQGTEWRMDQVPMHLRQGAPPRSILVESGVEVQIENFHEV